MSVVAFSMGKAKRGNYISIIYFLVDLSINKTAVSNPGPGEYKDIKNYTF